MDWSFVDGGIKWIGHEGPRLPLIMKYPATAFFAHHLHSPGEW